MPHVVACLCTPSPLPVSRSIGRHVVRRWPSEVASRGSKWGHIPAVRCVDGRRPCLAGRGVLPQQSVLLIIYIIVYNQATVNTPWQLFLHILSSFPRSARFQRFEPLHALLFAPASFEPPAGCAGGRGSGDAWTSISGPASLRVYPRAREPPPGCPRHPAAPRQARSAPLPAAPLTCMRQSVVTDSRPPG